MDTMSTASSASGADAKSIFISYAHADSRIATEIKNALEEAGITAAARAEPASGATSSAQLRDDRERIVQGG